MSDIDTEFNDLHVKLAAAQVALGMASEEVRELREMVQSCQVEILTLEAEVARLTETLERIEASDYKTTWALRDIARLALSPIARDALAGEEGAK